MKKIIFICSIISLFFISCTSHVGLAKTKNPVIHPDSAKAHMLALSAEDIFFLDQQDPYLLKKINKGTSITLMDVIHMQTAGLSAPTMIVIIQNSHTKFNLSTTDIIRLQTEGVPFKVINFMIKT